MRRNRFERVSSLCLGLALATVAAAACSGDGGTSPGGGGGGGGSSLTALCQEIQDKVISGAVRDGIPAVQLRDSDLVEWGSVWLDFLLPTDRVIGLEVDGEYLAVPLNILWWHEILNLNEHGLAITYCPLTGSSMVFERAVVAGAEFGVSGLLFKNNLVMYDRTEDHSSLWPQMLPGGFCGSEIGQSARLLPPCPHVLELGDDPDGWLRTCVDPEPEALVVSSYDGRTGAAWCSTRGRI